MLHKPQIRRGWYAIYSTTGIFSLIFSVWALQALAIGLVVQGSVDTVTGVGVAGVTVELHTANGSFWSTTTTDISGHYNFSDTLNPGTSYSVEPRAISDYNLVGRPNNSDFIYQSGDAARTIDFQLTVAAKTITGRVLDVNGNLITDADVILTPYNIQNAQNVGVHTDEHGAYSANVVGGTWFAEAAVNLSDSNYTQRWISEEQPFRVDFATSADSEMVTHDFQVTPAAGRVTVQLLNSDGNTLTTSDFTADIDFRRADGVGTKRKVRASDSIVSVYLTPGIYTISAYHRDLAGKSFDPAKTTFAIADGEDINLGTVTAEVNTAHLKGRVTNNAGRNVPGMPLEAIRESGSERPQAKVADDGTYDITVGSGTWTIGCRNDNGQYYGQVAPVTVTVKNGETVTGLNFQINNLDKTISGNVVDSAGEKITGYVGTAFVKTLDKKYKETASIINGSYSILYSSAAIPGTSVYVGVESADGSTYTGSGLAKVTISGARATKNIAVKQYNATLNGTLLFTSGVAVTNAGSDIEIEAVDEMGNFTSAAVNSNGEFSLKLAAGTWVFDYVIANPENTDGLINRPAAQNSVTIVSNQTKTANITVIRGTNIITGTVTSASGAVVPSASVSVDNRPTIENSGASKASQIISVTTITNNAGVYQVKVPDGTYLMTVGTTPEVGNSIAPDGKTTTVSGTTTATVNLVFEASNATITGKITTSGKADGGGVINAYSDNGKEASAVVAKNGTYTLGLTSGDTWHLVATDLKGKDLYESNAKSVTPKTGSSTANLSLTDTGINVPGPATKTCDADDTCSVSLPDGASATVPAFGIDFSGTVKLTMTPVIDLDRNALDTPATLTYEVKATDTDGYELKNLKKDAEITVPYNQAAAASDGLIESRLTTTYYDPNTNTWASNGASGLVDTKNNVATIRTSHLTKFAVTGTVKPVPQVTKVSVASLVKGSTTLTVNGNNFKSKVTAKVGSVKASKVTLKGNTLKVTFPTKNLKGVYALTIISGNGRSVTTAKNITIKNGSVTIKR